MRYVADLRCSVCSATFPADRVMNLCTECGRPVQIRLELERLRRDRVFPNTYDPERRDIWRFGALLPLNWDEAEDRPHIVDLGAGYTPQLDYEHPVAKRNRFTLEVKDEGRAHSGYGRNPTASFKDRGMAVVVSMARALGVDRLVVPTQGNAGDSLAVFAVAAGLRAHIVLSPETDQPVLGSITAMAALHPDLVSFELVPGTIVDAARRVREYWVPQGWFSVATFQEPGWRTEGKKSLGLELAEPRGERTASGVWSVPDVIVYPTGGGTGVVGMAKAFDELQAIGLIDSRRPRMICVQSSATDPLVRAFESGASDITPKPAGETLATGLNVAANPGHVNVLRILRESGGAAVRVTDEAIRSAIRTEWRERRFAWSPEGAAALAALPELIDRQLIRPGDRVAVINTASALKYLPSIQDELEGAM
jgi:threonine synthase